MPSLVDIPGYLLKIEKKHEFLRWVRDLPTGMLDKRQLIKLYRKTTNATLLQQDYKNAGV